MTTDERLERIEKSIADVNRYLVDFRSETINRLEIIDSRLTTLTGLYQSVEARMAPLSKAVLDSGAIANRMQIDSRDLRNSSSPRLRQEHQGDAANTSVYATRRFPVPFKSVRSFR